MHVYGYMHVCLGWFWKDQMKRWVCCPLNRGPAPKLASEEAIRCLHLQHRHYYVIFVNLSLRDMMMLLLYLQMDPCFVL